MRFLDCSVVYAKKWMHCNLGNVESGVSRPVMVELKRQYIIPLNFPLTSRVLCQHFG